MKYLYPQLFFENKYQFLFVHLLLQIQNLQLIPIQQFFVELQCRGRGGPVLADDEIQVQGLCLLRPGAVPAHGVGDLQVAGEALARIGA